MSNKPILHGRDHRGKNADGLGGGADPAVLYIGASADMGTAQGVLSDKAGGTHATSGHILTADGVGGTSWLAPSSTGGIDFDTFPQDGDWLYVESTDATAAGGSPNDYGIQLLDSGADGIKISSGIGALLIGTDDPITFQHRAARIELNIGTITTADSVYGLNIEANNTDGTHVGVNEAIRINATSLVGQQHGIRANVFNGDSTHVGTNTYGLRTVVRMGSGSSTGPVIGVDATGQSDSGATSVSRAIGARLRAGATGTNTSTKVWGVSGEATRNGNPSQSEATIGSHAKSVQAIIGYCSGASSGDTIGGLLLDLNGPTSGTDFTNSKPVEIFMNGTIIFRIDADGTVHIPTGKSYVSDL